MILSAFFILGIIIGSFLNVVIYRISEGRSITGRSYCPKCKKQLAWYDNIPLLSFLILKSRCRYCQAKISWQYPLVELSTGMLFALVGQYFFYSFAPESVLTTIFYLGVASFFIVIFVYDVLWMEIPGLVLWPAVGWAVVYNLVIDWAHSGGSESLGNLGSATYSGTLAATIAFTFFFLLVAVSREKWMGMGDAFLAIFLGLVLGWPEILLALFLAFSIGAVYGIILAVVRKKSLKTQVPFAPFLITGAMITIFFYDIIIEWYLNLFRLY